MEWGWRSGGVGGSVVEIRWNVALNGMDGIAQRETFMKTAPSGIIRVVCGGRGGAGNCGFG